ncbi:chemotaxis response regulator protein-glutamate methylesterase [Bacillus gobiensis]|uniref:protein-glutamate methylesterase/protein-glutamine glutaminase n=1 Tax=Bacillus gobiensis TaxID=1441095 RepID=UPI003D1B7C3C
MVRALIVDDSAFMRKLLHDFLSSDPSITIAGTVRNGRDALDKMEACSPDVITLDVEMPVMDGLETLEKILATERLPVIMVSSSTKAGAETTIKCLSLGAFDFVTKPSGSISLDLYTVKEELIEKVKAAARDSLRSFGEIATPIEYSPHINRDHLKRRVVCIGTSTGGPRALQIVLEEIPAAIAAPIFVVQHMPVGFTSSLASRLDQLCDVHVKEAEDGEFAMDGYVYIAPGGKQMSVVQVGTRLKIELCREDAKGGHCPSVNHLFRSLAKIKSRQKIAVVMTGMGNDGTEGLQKLLEEGQTNSIAESEESAIVFGMPKSVIAAGLVHKVRHVNDIAGAIMSYMK